MTEDLAARIAQLSRPKQELLGRLLGERGIALGRVILPRGEGRPAPMTHSQEQLWFLEQLGTVTPAYNEPFALILQGELDTRALEQSLDDLLRRHSVLRTVFRMHDGRLGQIAQPHQRVTLEVEAIAGPEAEHGWRRRAAQLAR
ncbi:MAG TPA: condensation domain-containing protein, partial [Kofleriaceae bacterium]|nr:condensation domain-containing protein [Kofleriaceae bacterium]